MHTVELLEEAIRAAETLGYLVRQDWLGGAGGDCVIKGRKWLFLDLAQSVPERLQLVLAALSREDAARRVKLSEPLQRLLNRPKAA